MDPEPTLPISRVSVEEFERDMRKSRDDRRHAKHNGMAGDSAPYV